MPHFTKTLRTEVGSINFYFNKIFTESRIRYHVSAIGRNGKAIIFHLEKVGNNWSLVKTEDLPHWLTAIEQKLSDAITEHDFRS